jgi:hemolysin activation/secretion protein
MALRSAWRFGMTCSWFCLVAAIDVHNPAVAAPAPPVALPGTIEPGRTPLPQLPAVQAPDFELTIESLRRAAGPEAGEQLSFRLNGVSVEGAHAIPASRFTPLYAKLIGHEVKLSDIAGIADAIETDYRTAGYLLTRVYVPPQRVHDGIFTITVVEGYIAGVAVVSSERKPLVGAGIDSLAHGYFSEVLRERPATNAAIERAMLLANDLPGRTAAGLLRPAADTPGASDLVVTEKPQPFAPTLSIDNRTSRYAGPVLVHLGAAIAPGLLAGDWLAGSFTATPNSAERLEGALSYAFPVGGNGAVVGVDASGTYGEPGDVLSALSLVTNSYSAGLRLHYPLLRSRARSLYVESGFAAHSADVATLGKPFSHDDWRTVDASLIFAENGWLSGASSVALTVTQGLPILGATRSGAPQLSRPGAAADFTKISLVARRLQRLAGPFSLSVLVQGQYAFAPLVAGEQIAFGGDSIGRGYDPAALLGDHGIGGTVELRYDRAFQDSWVKTAQPYVFSDSGAVWNRIGSNAGNSRLEALGGGVRLGLVHRITASLELAKEVWSVQANDNGRKAFRVLFELGIVL